MAVIKIVNKSVNQVSTSIGIVAGRQGAQLIIQTDNVPITRRLYDELEGLRHDGRIDYQVLHDPGMRNEIEAAPFFEDIGAGILGTPTTGDYQDGFFDMWTPNTYISNAALDISKTILQMAPAHAGLLTGQTLVLGGTTKFSAKIPSGLPVAWATLTPGSIIPNLIYDNMYTLTTPDSPTRFAAGRASEYPQSAGQATHVIDGVDGQVYDIGTYGPGTIGNITISNLSPYNTLWLKANALVNYTHATEGRKTHVLKHTEAGQTNALELFYDDVNTIPTFDTPLAIALVSKVSKWLSGIEAWGYGTTINISYVAASGIFTKAYHPIAVGQVSCVGHNTSIDNPVSVPDVADPMSVSRDITLDATNEQSLTPQVTALIQKPEGTNASSVQPVPAIINTYGIESTNASDEFVDEDKRIVLDSGVDSSTATPFDSSIPLVNGNAQQLHSGVLQYPDIIDYPGFTGDQIYQRFMAKDTSSIGALTLAGILHTDINPYGTGDLNVLLQLTTDGKYFDLGRQIGDNNGDGSGSSPSNSIGAKNALLSSGSVINWSIGTYSTANNNNEYRLVVIFKNDNHALLRLEEAV